MLRLVSLGGIFVMIALCFALSHNRRAIKWSLVAKGLLLQALLGFVFLYWDAGNAALQAFGGKVDGFLKLAQGGAEFVFGALAQGDKVAAAFGAQSGFLFAFMVLPTLIFFSAFMAVLYHFGVMQLIVRAMAAVMVRVLGTSGSESTSACANIFVGQTEAPLLVRPFLPRMTMSELHAVMVGGFATIAGGVFALYIGFGVSAGHLMVGSVMAVPAGLVCTKIMWPETEPSETLGRVGKVQTEAYGNVVEAAAAGAGDGLKLALNVGAMLIAFLGLVAVLNATMTTLFHPSLTVQNVLATAFYPVAMVMGVQGSEVGLLAELLGTKIAVTELVAYSKLGPMVKAGEVSPRTAMIASFALCGFANIGSVAIQVGGLSAMAPDRRADLARIGLRAMLGGAIATCMTACVAGVLGSEGGA
ncbi:MAG: NupC/NupG family nucleoside CNT transporter [Planctomycetes bacterium]|nr:NupC/NupG family nucleoside CNT transporter [Planctomycetota bacterium]